jgi:hypothetical protein
MLMEAEIQSTQTQTDSSKLFTCVFFQQFVSTWLNVQCTLMGQSIPALKFFEPKQVTLFTTLCYFEQDGTAATLYTSIQEVLW